MKVRTTLFVLVVLLFVLNLFPVVPVPVQAANSMTIELLATDPTNIQIGGQVTLTTGKFYLAYVNLYDKDRRFVKKVTIKENPFKYTFYGLNVNSTYFIEAEYWTVDPFLDGYSNMLTAKTKAEPVLSAINFDTGSTSVKFSIVVSVNGNTLKEVGYRLYLASDNSLVADKVVMTNVTVSGTKGMIINDLKPFTAYKMTLYAEAALGWRKFFGPYEFKTKLASISIAPKPTNTPTPSPSPTPSPTPSPSPTPTPSPGPTATPGPTSTPKPTTTATTQSTTAVTTPAGTTQTVVNTPTPEPTASPSVTSPDAETTLPVETTAPSGSPSQETTPESTQPQSNDSSEFPWTVLIVALAALAGIGFGVGGALMIIARRKK